MFKNIVPCAIGLASLLVSSYATANVGDVADSGDDADASALNDASAFMSVYSSISDLGLVPYTFPDPTNPQVGSPHVTNSEASCPSGRIIVGILGRAGTLVDGLQLVCGSLRTDGHLDTAAVTYSNWVGGYGGTYFTKMCPSDMVVSGFRGRAGDAIDGIAIECTPIAQSILDGSPVWEVIYESTIAGGPGGKFFYAEAKMPLLPTKIAVYADWFGGAFVIRGLRSYVSGVHYMVH